LLKCPQKTRIYQQIRANHLVALKKRRSVPVPDLAVALRPANAADRHARIVLHAVSALPNVIEVAVLLRVTKSTLATLASELTKEF
jgi:hypothetical protein